jgi:hypothetical protein
VNVERAADAVWRAHQRGGRVVSRADAELLVRLVLVAAGALNVEQVRQLEAGEQAGGMPSVDA